MAGEIDLELYTICVIRLNNVFQKIEDNEEISEINSDLTDCINDFSELYGEIVHDLKEGTVDYNEYDPFFENGINTFPTYVKNIEKYSEKVDDEELKTNFELLLLIFRKLIKVGHEYFKARGVQ
jgi:hypothetical protein